MAGADVDTGANTAENAAQNNMYDTIWDALCVLYDSGKIAYGYYVDDEGVVKEGFIDLAVDTTALFIPFVPAGITKGVRASNEVLDSVQLAEKVAGATLPEAISGFTKHGINQAISRDGVGVSSAAILDAVKNPLKVTGQSGGKFVFKGKNAVVVLNKEGKLVTNWSKGINGVRIK